MDSARERNCHPDYWKALDGLKKRAGATINNDTVALEAGRGKGSIKKSRPEFAKLIAAIDDAAVAKIAKEGEAQLELARCKAKVKDLESTLQASFAREASLVMELLTLKKELVSFRKGQVLPLVRRGDGAAAAGV